MTSDVLFHVQACLEVMQCCMQRANMLYSHLMLLSVEESICGCGEPAEVGGSLPDLSTLPLR